MRVLASAVLLLLTGHAEAWGSSPKKAATRESPAAADEVCANPTAAADNRLTRQVQQLAEMVGAQFEDGFDYPTCRGILIAWIQYNGNVTLELVQRTV